MTPVLNDIDKFIDICKGKVVEVFHLHERSWKKEHPDFKLSAIDYNSINKTLHVRSDNEVLYIDYVENLEFGHNNFTTALVITRAGHTLDMMLHLKKE